MSNAKLLKLLKAHREGYRQIAFPRKRITTRDQQNHALVARGGYAACSRLIERLAKYS